MKNKNALDTAKEVLDTALDYLYEYSDPVAGDCPVCALWRGIGIGAVLMLVVCLVLL